MLKKLFLAMKLNWIQKSPEELKAEGIIREL